MSLSLSLPKAMQSISLIFSPYSTMLVQYTSCVHASVHPPVGNVKSQHMEDEVPLMLWFT